MRRKIPKGKKFKTGERVKLTKAIMKWFVEHEEELNSSGGAAYLRWCALDDVLFWRLALKGAPVIAKVIGYSALEGDVYEVSLTTPYAITWSYLDAKDLRKMKP